MTTYVPIPPQLILDTTSITASGVSNIVTVLVNSSYFMVRYPSMFLNESVTIAYSGTIYDFVHPDETIITFVESSWTSVYYGYYLPGRQHNASGTYPWAVGSHQIVVLVPSITAQLLNSSLVDTLGSLMNIAEVDVFVFNASFPSAVMNTNITVTLPWGMIFRYGWVVSIGSLFNYSLLSVGSPPTSVQGNIVKFVFGNIQNFPNYAPWEETIAVALITQIDNVASNVHNTTLTISGSVEADTTVASASSTVRILEPEIQVAIAPITTYQQIDAGNNVTYQIVVSHKSTSQTYAYGFTVDVTVGSYQSIVATTPGSLPSNVTILSDTKLARWMFGTLPLGSEFVATFTAVVLNNVYPNTQGIVAVTNLTCYSYPGNPYNLSGRLYSASATSVPLVISIPVLTFSTFNSSISVVPLPKIAIEEAVTLLISTTLPECTTAFSTLLTLPSSRMIVLGVQSIYGSQINCSSQTITNTANHTVTVNFGVCENLADNVVNAGDTLNVSIAVVPADVSSNLLGNTLVISGESSYSNGLLSSLRLLTSSITLTIVEPKLSMSITPVSSTGPLSAGDNVTYHLQVLHQGISTEAAFDLTAVAHVGIYENIVGLTPGSLTTNAAFISTDLKTVTWTFNQLLLGTTFSAYFTTVVLNNVYPATLGIVSNGNVSFDSVPLTTYGIPWLGGRVGSASATSQALTISVPTLAFSIFNSSIASVNLPKLTVNEAATALISVQLPRVTTYLSTLLNLPLGRTAILTTQIQLGPQVLCSGSTITNTNNYTLLVDLGTCVNTYTYGGSTVDYANVSITFATLNVGSNINGASLVLDGSSTYSNGALANHVALSSSSTLYIVEPKLDILVEAVTAIGVLGAGNNVTYQITVWHTPQSTAPASDLVITALVGNFEGIITITSGTPYASSNISLDGKTASWQLRQLALGVNFTANFTGTVLNNVYPRTPGIVAVTNVVYDSVPLVTYGQSWLPGRSGYATSTSPALIIGAPTLSFSLYNSSIPYISLPQVSVEEGVNVLITVALPPMTTNLSVHLNLPSNRMVILDSEIVIGSQISCTKQNITNVGNNSYVVNFGTCVDSIGTSSAVLDNSVNVTVLIAPNDASSNVNSALLPLTALAYISNGSLSSTSALSTSRDLIIVEPKLQESITAITPTGILSAGDNVTYQIFVDHTGQSTAAAFDFVALVTVGPFENIVAISQGSLSANTTIAHDSKSAYWSMDKLLLGQTFIGYITVTVQNTVYPATIGIQADLTTTYGSVPYWTYWFPWLKGRPYSTIAHSQSLTIGTPTLSFNLLNTSISSVPVPYVTVDEAVSVLFLVTLPRVTTNLSTLLVLPTSRTSFLGAEIELGSAVSCSGREIVNYNNNSLLVDLGTCVDHYPNLNTGSNYVNISLMIAVADVAQNVNGASLLFSGTATYSNGSFTNPTKLSGSTSVFVVEPHLTVTVTAITPTGILSAGSNVTYQVEVWHTGASTAPAFDVVVVAQVGIFENVVATANGNFGASVAIAGDGKSATWLISTIPLGVTHFVAEFTSTVQPDVYPATLGILSTVNVSYDSVPGSTNGLGWLKGRPGSVSAKSQTLTIDVPHATFFVSSVSLARTVGLNLSIGEVFYSKVVIGLPHVTSILNVSLRLPANGLYATDVYVISSASVLCSPKTTISSTIAANDTVVVDFGQCIIVPGQSNDNVTIVVTEIVANTPSVYHGVVLRTNCSISYSNGSLNNLNQIHLSDSVTVTEPTFLISVSQDTKQYLMLEDSVGFYLNIAPAPADNVMLYLIFPSFLNLAGFSFDSYGNQPLRAPITLSNSTSIVSAFSLGSIFSNASTSLNFTTVIANGAPPGSSLTVDVLMTYTSVPDQSRARYGQVKASYNPIYVAYVACNTTLQSSFSAYDPLPRISIGEQLTFSSTCYIRGQYSLTMYVPNVMVTAGATLQSSLSFLSSSLNTVGSHVSVFSPFSTALDGKNDINGTVGLTNMYLSSTYSGVDTVNMIFTFYVHNFPFVMAGLTSASTLLFNFGGFTVSNAFNFIFVEPSLTYTASLSPAQALAVDAGTSLVFSFRVNAAATDQFSGSASTVTFITAMSYMNVSTSAVTSDSSSSAALSTGITTTTLRLGGLGFGQSWLVSYRVIVSDSILPGIIFNHTSAFSYLSAPGVNARSYSQPSTFFYSTSKDLNFAMDFISYSAYGPSILHPTIGDTLILGINITLPRVTSPDTYVTLSFPASLLVSSIVVSNFNGVRSVFGKVPAISYGNTSAMVNFSTLQFPSSAIGTGVISVLANFTVLNLPEVQQHDILTVQGGLNYSIYSQSRSLTRQISIETPFLLGNMSVTPEQGDAGNFVTVTTFIYHAPNSSSDAYDLLITMQAHRYFDFLPYSGYYNISPAGATSGSAADFAGQTCTTSIVKLGIHQTLILVYRLQLNIQTTPGQALSFVSGLSYKSTATAASIHARTYSLPLSVGFNTTPMPPQSFGISTYSGDYIHPFPNAIAVGEVITSFLTLNFIKGTSPNVTVAAGIPLLTNETIVSMAIIDVSLVLNASNFTGSLMMSSPLSVDYYSDNFNTSTPFRARRFAISPYMMANRVLVNLGTIVNSFSSALSTQDNLTLAFSAVLLNNPFNVNLKQLHISTTGVSVGSSSNTFEVVTVLEPVLVVSQSLTPAILNPNYLSLQVFVQHKLNISLIEAHNVSISVAFNGDIVFTMGNFVGNKSMAILGVVDTMNITLPVTLAASTIATQRICTAINVTYTGPYVGVFAARQYLLAETPMCYSVPQTSASTFLGSLSGIFTIVGAAMAFIRKHKFENRMAKNYESCVAGKISALFSFSLLIYIKKLPVYSLSLYIFMNSFGAFRCCWHPPASPHRKKEAFIQIP